MKVKRVPTPFLLCFPSSLRLTLTNCNVEHIATYFSQDVIKEMDSSSFHIPSANERDLLSMLHEPGVPPHQLSLKVGNIASIMRNLCIERGLVKNARVHCSGTSFASSCSKRLTSPPPLMKMYTCCHESISTPSLDVPICKDGSGKAVSLFVIGRLGKANL